MPLQLLWTYIRRSLQRDPTTDWPLVSAAPLVFDLSSAALNGVPLDGSFMQLRQFGRPSNPRPYRAQQLAFARLGLEVHLYLDDQISHFTCVFRRSAGSPTRVEFAPDFSPCSIQFRLREDTCIQVTSQTTRTDLACLLGEPQEETQGTGIRALGYFYPNIYLNFEFDSQDELLLLDLEWLSQPA